MKPVITAMLSLSFIVISLCLAPSVAQAPFKPEKKQSPLKFNYGLPTENIDDFTKAPNTPTIAVVLPSQEDICCDEKVIETFNKSPENYFYRVCIYKCEIKEYYLRLIYEIETRICKVMQENLKVIVWVEMVNFFNKHPHFRKFLLGEKLIVPENTEFEQWDYRILADKISKYAFNASLPDSVPAVNPSELDGFIAAVTPSLSCHAKNEELLYDEYFGGPLDYLKRDLSKVNDRFKQYEDIVDLVRKVLKQPERDGSHAHLFNPVARWFT